MTEVTEQPTITTRPDRPNEVLIHLPEFTYFDSQVWEADLGIPTAALAALRDAITAHLDAGRPSPRQADRREQGGHASTSSTLADLPPLPAAMLQRPMPEQPAGA